MAEFLSKVREFIKKSKSFILAQYKSGDHNIALYSDNEADHSISIDGHEVYHTEDLGAALNRYYHELKSVANSQTQNTDLALGIFGDMVVEQNRRILPMLNLLGRLDEVKNIEKQMGVSGSGGQGVSFGVVPLQEQKDITTIVSDAIPKDEISKKKQDRPEQHAIVGGNVGETPKAGDFGMSANVRKEEIVEKYKRGTVAAQHKYEEKLQETQEPPQGTYVTHSKGHIYAYPKSEWGVEEGIVGGGKPEDIVRNILQQDNWVILTAENPGGKSISAAENAERNKQLLADLKATDYEVTPIAGAYGTTLENSFLVRGISQEEALALGKKFGQESVLTKLGLLFPENNTYRPANVDNTKFDPELKENFSTITIGSTPVKFSIPIDFEAEAKPIAMEDNKISGTLKNLSTEFKNNGFELYEVGGRVRDSLLGRESHDIDLTTGATPEETENILISMNLGSIYDVGKRFGTIGLNTKDGQQIEITTFRGEQYTPGSRKPEVTFGISLKDDLARRDFTINSLARDISTGEILDYFGGQEDLKNKVIRAVGNAADRYSEDPLRMLRAARFAAQLGFTVDTDMPEPEKLKEISKERIAAELDKMLLSKNPMRGFDVMKQYGLLEYVIPELNTLIGIQQLPHHANDVYEHVMEVVDNASKFSLPAEDKQVLMLAALLHDIAKPTTRTEVEGKTHFYEHDKAGAEKAVEILTDLRYSNDIITRVHDLIKNHMYILHTLNSADVSDKQLRRFIFNVGIENVPLLIDLAKADAKSSTRADISFIDKLAERINNLPVENKVIINSPIDGNEIMERFNLKPSRKISEIKNYLINKVVDGELAVDDKETAYKLADEYLKTNPIVPEVKKQIIHKIAPLAIAGLAAANIAASTVSDLAEAGSAQIENSVDSTKKPTDENDAFAEFQKLEKQLKERDAAEKINKQYTEEIDTTNKTKRIPPTASTVDDGGSILQNEGYFGKQIGPKTLTAGWVPGAQTMGKIPVRVPIRRKGMVYYGIRWKNPGMAGLVYPRMGAASHLIRPEDFLEDSAIHHTLYYGTDKETAKGIFKHGFHHGTFGKFGLGFYLFTDESKAKKFGEVIIMAKLDVEDVFVIAHPNPNEEPVRYADRLVQNFRDSIGTPEDSNEIASKWTNAWQRYNVKALAYPQNLEDNSKEFDIEVITFTGDVLKVVADVRKEGEEEPIEKWDSYQQISGDENPIKKGTYDYTSDMDVDAHVKAPSPNVGTATIPDYKNTAPDAMFKDFRMFLDSFMFSPKDQQTGEIGNEQHVYRQPQSNDSAKQKPIVGSLASGVSNYGSPNK